MSVWVPRRELALPNELLHKIILWVLCDSIHAICTSTQDTTWDRNVMETLHEVSPFFRAISSEIAAKAFDISKDVRNEDEALHRTLRAIFAYLSNLGSKFRHPSEWDTVSFQTIDCSASSFVFAYALYLSCTSLRRNASRSASEGFETTHNVIFSALVQSEALCDRVKPAEMTLLLRESLQEEYELARLGVILVKTFNSVNEYAEILAVFKPDVAKDGTGPVSGTLSLIHKSLLKIESFYGAYEAILDKKQGQLEPRIFELPGVLKALRRVGGLITADDQFDLYRRIKKFVDHWSFACPFGRVGARSYDN